MINGNLYKPSSLNSLGDRMEYTTAKVPQWAYANGQRVAQELLHQGLGTLPSEVLRPVYCPICGGQLEVFEARYRYLRCTSCTYMQQDFTVTSNFATGILFGLGLAALLYLLFKK